MPRRPRPLSRTLPQKWPSQAHLDEFPSSSTKAFSGGSGPPNEESDESRGGSSDTSSVLGGSDIVGEGMDDDAPQVAQWVDEDEVEEVEGVSENEVHDPGPSQLRVLQSDLSSLPLGALRKAQHILAQAKADSDVSDSDSSESGDEPPKAQKTTKEKTKPERSIKPRIDIAKRSNKHAPMEVTSKRPVSRKRNVIEVKKLQPRDPRFLSVAGEFSEQKFQRQYGFLAEAHTTELRTLRETLKRAQRLLASSPRDLFAEREQEVNRLEFAVKKSESIVNKDRRDKVEQDALGKVAQQEREKRKHGKGDWWLKESDKRELLMRARFDALAADGGKRAVKKAIEKKQKKIGQKEKKSRPFPKSTSWNKTERPRKRTFDSTGEATGIAFDKRRRVAH